MKNKKRNNKFINIIKDLYYRLQALPLMFLFWILIIVWKHRIWRWQSRLLDSRRKIDIIWELSQHLDGKKPQEQESKLRNLEKYYLRLEISLKEDEERYLKQKELLDKYLGKVFDPT